MSAFIQSLGRVVPALFVAGSILLGFGMPASAQNELPREILAGKLFPPDIVLRQADQIGLDGNQRSAVMKAMQEAKGVLEEGQKKLREANQRLNSALSGSSIDEQQVLTLLDNVLRAERMIKRGRLTMLARVKNQLSAEQQEKLQALLRQQSQRSAQRSESEEDARIREEVSAKMQRVRDGVERWRKGGRDPGAVMDSMRNLNGLMLSGKLQEAKQLLDEALARLESEQGEPGH